VVKKQAICNLFIHMIAILKMVLNLPGILHLFKLQKFSVHTSEQNVESSRTADYNNNNKSILFDQVLFQKLSSLARTCKSRGAHTMMGKNLKKK
jgi:hypothetical protein